MNNKVIIFDLDDTLYKEIDYLKSAFKEIAHYLERRFDIKGVHQILLYSYFNHRDAFDDILYKYDLNISKSELLEMYRNHKPNISLDCQTQKILNFLKDKDYTLGLVTDGRSITQRNKIASLKLYRYINEVNIIISEEFGSEKPNLANYLYFERLFPNSEFYYIGDNPRKDFIGPNSLKWKTICLKDDGRNIHNQEKFYTNEYQPLFYVDNINDIIKYIK